MFYTIELQSSVKMEDLELKRSLKTSKLLSRLLQHVHQLHDNFDCKHKLALKCSSTASVAQSRIHIFVFAVLTTTKTLQDPGARHFHFRGWQRKLHSVIASTQISTRSVQEKCYRLPCGITKAPTILLSAG